MKPARIIPSTLCFPPRRPTGRTLHRPRAGDARQATETQSRGSVSVKCASLPHAVVQWWCLSTHMGIRMYIDCRTCRQIFVLGMLICVVSPNENGQRREPAADGVGFVSELNGWLPFAAPSWAIWSDPLLCSKLWSYLRMAASKTLMLRGVVVIVNRGLLSLSRARHFRSEPSLVRRAPISTEVILEGGRYCSTNSFCSKAPR